MRERVELPGARASQDRPANGSAASGLSRPKGPARTQHASEAMQAVGSRQYDLPKCETKSDITKDHAQASFTCQAWSLFVVPRIALTGYVCCFSELKRGSFFSTSEVVLKSSKIEIGKCV